MAQCTTPSEPTIINPPADPKPKDWILKALGMQEMEITMQDAEGNDTTIIVVGRKKEETP